MEFLPCTSILRSKRYLLFFTLILFAYSGSLFAQTVSGKVVNEKGEGLIGVNILIQGESQGVATDTEGNFTLENLAAGKVLKVSYTGYVDQEVVVNGQSLTITLEQGQTLGEVVVTADKTENTLQRTGIAVTTIEGLKLREMGLVSSEQVLRNVPNVVVQGAARGYVIAIRGLGSDLPPGVGESAVSTNFDGIYNFRAESGTIGFFDMNRVEVLRGPQGTLYGRNATGGVVNVLSNNPVLKKFEGYGTIDIGNYSHLRAEGAINAPLGDKAAARVSFASVNRDGYLSNGSNDAVATGVRAKLRFQPSKKFNLIIAGEFNHLGGKGPGFVNYLDYTSGDKDKILLSSASPDVSQDYNSTKIWADMTLEAGPGTLTILPAYQVAKGTVVGDRGMGLETSFDPDPAEQISFEARYASKPGSKVGWVGGIYYYGLENNVGGIPVPDARNTDKTSSTAAFGQVTIPFGDKVRGLAGVRFASDGKSFSNGTIDAEETWTAFDWKLGLEGDLAEDALGYITLATGQRPGGFNSFSPETPRFQPESLLSAELGIKSRIADKVQLNGALFYYDYNDFQVADFFFPPGSPFPVLDISNRGKVVNSGLEVETKSLLSKNTILGIAFTYLNSEYKESFELHGGPFDPPGPVDMQGDRLPHAPKLSFNGSLEHTFILGNAGRLTPNFQIRWIDDQYIAPFPGQPQTQEAYSMLDANLRYSSKNGNWSINAYLRNMTNEVIKIAYFADAVIVGSPRQGGISFTGRF